jgi:hypothetical protein
VTRLSLIVLSSAAIAATALAFSCSPGGAEFLDSFRFAELDRRCKSATEVVHRRLRTDVIDIADQPWDVVHNETYAPHVIVVHLLVAPQAVAAVNLRYVDNVSPTEPCRGSFVTVVHGFDSMPKAIDCTQRTRSDSVAPSPVMVKIEHGQLERDIRPFRMVVIDVKSGDVIAEQSSFELLLGHLRGKNRLWAGMGGSQVARACKLTSPRKFIESVIR